MTVQQEFCTAAASANAFYSNERSNEPGVQSARETIHHWIAFRPNLAFQYMKDELTARGVDRNFAAPAVWALHGICDSVAVRLLNRALSNRYFRPLGLPSVGRS